jgi:Fe-S-cluster-containing hydrogenase component 2
MKIDEHPTVLAVRSRPKPAQAAPLSATWLKQLAREHGADDVGLVELERPALSDQRHLIQQVYAETQTLLSFVVRMNQEPVRSPVRSVTNQEFHATYDAVNEVARDIVRALSDLGIPACNSVAAFPMEVELPGRAWMVAHKPVAVAAGLGHMGLHRNVIHPKFGSFVLLGTVLLGLRVDRYDQPVDYNPCLSCNLCVAACPVGAIKHDGAFDFTTCYTHNYREFLGNFGGWVEQLADAKDAADYRKRVSDSETRSMWQSLSFKPGYKAAYCVSVCPAGEDVIGPYLDDRKGFVERVVHPLRDKAEPVYVLAGSDAEVETPKRFPNKTVRRVAPSLRSSSIPAFVMQLRLGFQRGRARGLSGCFQLRFESGVEGKPAGVVTLRIHEQQLSIEQGAVGKPDLTLSAGAATWLEIANRARSRQDALRDGFLTVSGSLDLLEPLTSCFPHLL